MAAAGSPSLPFAPRAATAGLAGAADGDTLVEDPQGVAGSVAGRGTVATLPVAPSPVTTPWTWGRVKDVAWAILGIAGILYIAGSMLQYVTSIVLIFVVSALIAFMLNSPVSLLQERAGWSRTVAALATYAVGVVALVVVGGWGITQLASQVSGAITNLPAALQALQDRIPDLETRAQAIGVSMDFKAAQTMLLAQLQGAGVASQGVAWAAAAGDFAMSVFIVLFLSFYLVVDGERLSDAFVEVTPDRWKSYVLFTQKTLFRVVGGYLRGQLIMGAIIGVAVFLGCLALGVRYSLLLGIMGFFFEMIPVIGPVLIGVTMTGVALFSSFQLAAIVLVFYLVLQIVESNVLGPKITGDAVGLHPIASMLGLLAGARLFGLWGALFAVPVLGFTFVVIAAVYRQIRGLDPEAVVTPRQPRRILPTGLLRRAGAGGQASAGPVRA